MLSVKTNTLAFKSWLLRLNTFGTKSFCLLIVRCEYANSGSQKRTLTLRFLFLTKEKKITFKESQFSLLSFFSRLELSQWMRKLSLVGTGIHCFQPVVTNGSHCHPISIVPIVTQNQTHRRGRRLIGCTLQCFHPPLHMTECRSSRPWICAAQSTVHIQRLNDKRAVNIWRFGTECICQWLSVNARRNSLYENAILNGAAFTELDVGMVCRED